MEIKDYVVQKEIELEEGFIGNKELKILARQGDKYAARLPKRDMGKDVVGLPQSDRQFISSFYSSYVNNVDHLNSLKPKIDPVKDSDTAGRKALKTGLTALNAKLKKNFEDIPKVEAKLKAAESKSEVSKSVTKEKSRIKKTQKGTMLDMKKQGESEKRSKQESDVRVEKAKIKAAEKKAKKQEEIAAKKAADKGEREKERLAKKEKRQKWVADVKSKLKRGK